MVVVHANIRTKAEDEAFRELRTTYTEYGKSIDFADCVENILRERNATKDFQDFTKVIDPETNSNRLVEHLQLKAANTIQMLLCGIVGSGNAEISDAIVDKAYTALRYFLILSGKSEPYADCVVFALKVEGATKDFKEGNVFTDLQRLTEHLKDKVDAIIFIILCVGVRSGQGDLVEATATATIEMFLNSAKRSKEYAACVVEQMKLEMASKHIKEGDVDKFTEHFKTKINDLKVLFVLFTICAIATLGYGVEIGNEEPTGSKQKCYDFFNVINKNGSNSQNKHKFVDFVCGHIIVSIVLAIVALIIAFSIVSCLCRCLCCCRSGRGRGYETFA
ncbi:unnamed protein product [Diamesa tonsa]